MAMRIVLLLVMVGALASPAAAQTKEGDLSIFGIMKLANPLPLPRCANSSGATGRTCWRAQNRGPLPSTGSVEILFPSSERPAIVHKLIVFILDGSAEKVIIKTPADSSGAVRDALLAKYGKGEEFTTGMGWQFSHFSVFWFDPKAYKADPHPDDSGDIVIATRVGREKWPEL
jgi:hypothetical protein